MIAATSSRTPYVETDKKALECSFRSLDFVNTMYVGEGLKVLVPKLSETTHMGIKQLHGKGVRVGKGLGKRLQGMLRPIVVIQKKDRFGLGYKSDKRDRQRLAEEKKEKRMASFLRMEKESANLEIPSLNYSFISGGFFNPEVIQCKSKERVVDMEEAFGSLSIDMVEVEDQEMTNTGLPPLP